MREIKFRGKRIDNGEWVYGYLTQSPYGLCITNNESLYHVDGGEWNFDCVVVDPKTVGQYLNRKERDGKHLYEGDIIEHKASYSAYGEDTDFEDKTATWVGLLSLRMSAGIVLIGKCRIESDIDGRVIYEGPSSKRVRNAEKNATLLGNKFDNPELINEPETSTK